jgi:UDP-glucose 4-epimerase
MILVTGGAGYIGSHFLKTYLEINREQQVLVVDNLSLGHKEALKFSHNIILEEEDIGNTAAMRKLMLKYPIEAVVHFAGSCYVAESQQNPVKYLQNNLRNSLNLFEVMESCGVRKIIFSSSCAVYGPPKYVPLDEDHPQQPASVYGLTKHMIEQALNVYSKQMGWHYLALRYANVAGADESSTIGESHYPEPHLIPLVLQVANGKGNILDINGDDWDTPDGTCIRDYLHVSDLAQAHIVALEKLRTGSIFGAINIGTGKGYSIKEIIDVCRRITGREIATRILPRREGDPSIYVAGGDLAAKALKWKPHYGLEDIITSAWKWEQSRRY